MRNTPSEQRDNLDRRTLKLPTAPPAAAAESPPYFVPVATNYHVSTVVAATAPLSELVLEDL